MMKQLPKIRRFLDLQNRRRPILTITVKQAWTTAGSMKVKSYRQSVVIRKVTPTIHTHYCNVRLVRAIKCHW